MVQAATAVQATRIGEYLATGEHPPLLGSASSSVAPSEAFRCEDGVYVGVQAATAHEWQSLCSALGLEELAANETYATIAGRVAARAAISARLAAVFSTRPARWWQIVLARAGVPCARILHFEELVNHPQVTENHYIEAVETETYGTVYATGLPWAFSRTPASILPTAPAGKHTTDIHDELAAAAAPGVPA
jgi:crotonobetainyl-CoA:carnitine CoA-transferase CaiB-like acyl-CoA transferase